MPKCRLAWAILAAGLVLGGCATGPKYSEVKSSIPDLAPGAGRIYFYRTSMYGGAFRPEIRLNGTPVGKAVSGGFFFVDKEPGSYVVAMTGSQESTMDLILQAGQTLYVRTHFVGFAPVLIPKAVLISNSIAQTEINDLSYVGKELSRK
jgi:hypothetical protein